MDKFLKNFLLHNIRWIILGSILIFFYISFSWNIKYAHRKSYIPKYILIAIEKKDTDLFESFEKDLAELLMNKLSRRYEIKYVSKDSIKDVVRRCEVHFSIALLEEKLEKDIISIPIAKKIQSEISSCDGKYIILISQRHEYLADFIEIALKRIITDGAVNNLYKKWNI